jgi:glycosyltransferase involved in cell wall biosynthesis
MDISGVKIDLMNKLPIVSNLSFIRGNEEDKLPQPVDCIIVNEIIEYQKEPWAFVDKIEKNVKEGGRVLICTANGPWAKAAKNNTTYRLWNFDRQDIRDMFGKKKGYAINTASAGDVETTGEALGWFFISYIKDSNKKTNEINMERKLHIQRPRQTLALSMIVKNAEDMLHRTLKSVEDLVDEIIVIDTGSEDSTREIAKKYTDKVYSGSDPLVEGFETPRNETLKHITSDWILWIDSDEVLLRGENLRKYLRDNIYNGYSIKQHHFSAVPPNIFTPDLPIRVFRTDRDIKWYGIVHEHCEIELNESIKASNLISDVDIGHDGYLTEGIRRKRFDRNYKLVLRDREKYPERRLGKFLKIRDDVHVVRYTLEENKGILTTDLIKICEEIIEDVRKDFLGKDDHFQMDALGFYSEALRILNRGFEISWCIAAAKKNPEIKPQDIVTYQFVNKSDVDIFFASKFKNMFEIFTGKYCGY